VTESPAPLLLSPKSQLYVIGSAQMSVALPEKDSGEPSTPDEGMVAEVMAGATLAMTTVSK
jgi:hypothetical protein